jgi:type IV secretory pathway protease TraF
MAYRKFNFLVRVEGSIATYLFQVTAANLRAAERKAREIPHLCDCRHISDDELAFFMKKASRLALRGAQKCPP